MSFANTLGSAGPMGLGACLHVAIFHVAVSLAYIVAYSALENRSPTMMIMSFVADARQAGRLREELVTLLKGVSPVEQRLHAMLHDNMVTEENGICRLTPKGRIWAQVFSAWSRSLNTRTGG